MYGMPDARPSYVEFELRPVEDRTASIKEGRTIYRDVAYAIVTPPGGHLVWEGEAKAWLDQLRKKNDPFIRHYDELFRAFTEGLDAPAGGTRLEDWPSITPAQVKQIRAANIRTVEDLAAANDSALSHIGMGARALRDRAVAWLDAANDTGKVAERLAALEANLERLVTENAALQAKVNEYEADRPKRGPGRPPKG